MAGILGSSVSTKAQILKVFSNYSIEDREDTIDLYMKYGMEYGVQHNVAIAMCLLYTNFFTEEIINNNLVGIGKQFKMNALEVFRSEEECIVAQYEMLRLGADKYYECDYPHSITYNNLLNNMSSEGEPTVLVGNIIDRYDVFISWKLDETGFSSTDFHTLIRDMDIVRLQEAQYDSNRSDYYFVRVATAPTRTPLLSMKREIERKGFRNVHVKIGKGFYTLEVGSASTQKEVNTVLKNLVKFGYSGYIESRGGSK